jgi:hypothetical protein
MSKFEFESFSLRRDIAEAQCERKRGEDAKLQLAHPMHNIPPMLALSPTLSPMATI